MAAGDGACPFNPCLPPPCLFARWEDAIRVAESSKHPEAEALKQKYYKWLLETGQEEMAGQVKEKEGDALGAISLYLKGGLPARAAQVRGCDGVMSWWAGRHVGEAEGWPSEQHRSAMSAPWECRQCAIRVPPSGTLSAPLFLR